MLVIPISMFGTVHDLNRELSRRGLRRTGPVRVYRAERGEPMLSCEIVYTSLAHQKLRLWFDRGNVWVDPFYRPTVRKIDTSPGQLNSMSMGHLR